MGKPQIAMPVLTLAGLCLFAGCTGKSAPPAPSAAPPAPGALRSAPPTDKNAPQGGGVDLDKDQPDGGGIKNPS